MAAQVDHPPGEVEVLPVARRPVQLDERHLDLGVAIDGVPSARTELALDRSDGADRDVEEPVVRERPVPRDRGLDEMADVVQLVAPGQVPVGLAAGDDLDVAVDVAVGSLGGRDETDDLVGRARQLGVRSATELPADRLEPLVDVGVEERVDDAEGLAEGLIRARLAGGQPQVREVADAVELGVAVADRALAVRPRPVGPQPAVQRHVRRAQRGQARGRRGARQHDAGVRAAGAGLRHHGR